MKRAVVSFVLVALFLLLATGLTFFVQPAKAASVTILSHSSYLDSIGSYWIVGEVQNLDTQPVRFVKITAAFYDSSNTTITDDFGYAGLWIILPDQKSPFDIVLSNETQASRVDHYTLEVEPYEYTSTLPLNLKILWSNSSVDSYGWVRITGEVENAGTINATNPTIWATLYDSDGKVVAVGDDGYLQPEFMFGLDFLKEYNQTTGQESSFNIVISSEKASLAKSYVLATESSLNVNRISAPTPTIPTSFVLPLTTVITISIVAATAVVVLPLAVLLRRKRNLRKQESNVSEANTQPKDGDGKPSTE
jgi:hypothetical protein